MPKRSKPKAKPKQKAKAKPATRKAATKAVSPRHLLDQVAEMQETRGLEAETVVGALCEVICTHQPTARKAVAMLAAMLDAAGIR